MAEPLAVAIPSLIKPAARRKVPALIEVAPVNPLSLAMVIWLSPVLVTEPAPKICWLNCQSPVVLSSTLLARLALMLLAKLEVLVSFSPPPRIVVSPEYVTLPPASPSVPTPSFVSPIVPVLPPVRGLPVDVLRK